MGLEGGIFMPEKETQAVLTVPDGALSQPPILSKTYWRLAAKNFSDTRMIAFAALIIAMRVVVKFFKIPLAAGLSLTFDCYVNSLGSLCYGPLVGLAVGAISDTLGCIIHPSGDYFLPFILTEMTSSFIFGLFLWKRTLTPVRVLVCKFTVNLVCNIILTSVLMKWYYYALYGLEDAQAYSIINLTRIAKNLILFPLEAVLITVLLGALITPLKSLRLLPNDHRKLEIRPRDIVLVVILMLISIGLVLLYVFVLKDFIAEHNIKLL